MNAREKVIYPVLLYRRRVHFWWKLLPRNFNHLLDIFLTGDFNVSHARERPFE